MIDVGSHGLLGLQHPANQIPQALRVLLWDLHVVALHDLQRQGLEVGGRKGRMQCAQLKQQGSQGPDIGFEGIGPAFYYFRREIVRRADQSPGPRNGVLHDLCDSKIPNFDEVITGEEDVLRLEVSVDDLAALSSNYLSWRCLTPKQICTNQLRISS